MMVQRAEHLGLQKLILQSLGDLAVGEKPLVVERQSDEAKRFRGLEGRVLPGERQRQTAARGGDILIRRRNLALTDLAIERFRGGRAIAAHAEVRGGLV